MPSSRQDRDWLAAALEPGNALSVDAHLRHAALLLRKPGSPCTLLASHVAQLLERSVPDAARREIACRKGCAFCCHQRVSVTGAEALALADEASANPALNRKRAELEAEMSAVEGLIRKRFLDGSGKRGSPRTQS